MLALAVVLTLAQSPVTVADPSVPTRKAKVSPTAGGALQVECVGGTCTGGGGASSGGGTVDGGDLRAHQGASNDGGYAWHVDLERLAGAAPSATNPLPARLTDGTSFYKGTTPADTQPVSAASLPLPTGAATEATLSGRLAEATFTARIGTQGQKTMAGSTPVVIASDQSGVPVTGPLTDAQLRASAVPVSLSSVPIHAVTQSGTWSQTATAVASATTPASCTTVGVTSTTVLASQAGRKDWTVIASPANTANCFFRRGATAVVTDLPLVPGQSFTDDGPDVYTGVVDAICASAAQTVCAGSL